MNNNIDSLTKEEVLGLWNKALEDKYNEDGIVFAYPHNERETNG